MAFDKRSFNKALKTHFTALGYTMHKNRKDYYMDCADGLTRLVVRTPDGSRGFFIGAQFADRGELSGNFSETPVRWFYFEPVLNGAMAMDYSDEDIDAGMRQVTDALVPYIAGGKAEIVAHLNDFYHNDLDSWVVAGRDLDERNADDWLVYFGFEPVDPYSDTFFSYDLERMRANAGSTKSMTIDVYLEHKEFFDRYAERGCRLTVDERAGQVWITSW